MCLCYVEVAQLLDAWPKSVEHNVVLTRVVETMSKGDANPTRASLAIENVVKQNEGSVGRCAKLKPNSFTGPTA